MYACVQATKCAIVHLNVELGVFTVGAVWVSDSGGAHHADFLCSSTMTRLRYICTDTLAQTYTFTWKSTSASLRILSALVTQGWLFSQEKERKFHTFFSVNVSFSVMENIVMTYGLLYFSSPIPCGLKEASFVLVFPCTCSWPPAVFDWRVMPVWKMTPLFSLIDL